MSFEAFVLAFLHERSKTVQDISNWFSKDTEECQKVVDSLLEDSFLYSVSGSAYRSTPAGMEFVKRELEENAVNELPSSILPDMPHPLYVKSLSKDKKSVMGIYDDRLGRKDIYPVIPDVMTQSGYAGSILLHHIYDSVFFLKTHSVTKNGKGTLFKNESECISLEIAKKELEFLRLTLDVVMKKLDIKTYVAELVERRCALPSVTDGSRIALNEVFVLENHFGCVDFSEKKCECFDALSEQCDKVKEILDKGRGFSSIPKILNADLTNLC